MSSVGSFFSYINDAQPHEPKTLKSIDCAYFSAVIKYGIIFCGNSSNSGKTFTHKRKSSELWLVHNPELHVQVCLNNWKFCLFHANIYFVINNQENFQTHWSVHNINTRNKHHLRRPNLNMSCFQKSTFYGGINIFNVLPCSLTVHKNEKAKFKVTLRKYVNTQFFLWWIFLYVRMICNTVL